MKFTGAECVLCKKKFEDGDDVVVCPVCGSPHHRQCWEENGGCANSALHKDNYSWEAPEELIPKAEPPKNEMQEELGKVRFKNGEKAVQCPHCGSLNYENDAYCMNCQKPLHDEGENLTIPGNTDGDEQKLKIFQENLRRFGGLKPDAPVNSATAEDLSEYIGGGNPGRIIRKISSMERYGKKYSFSFAAFFFGPLWYFYRKMIKQGLIYSLILAIVFVTSSALYTATAPISSYYKGTFDIISQFYNNEITEEESIERISELAEKKDSTVYKGRDKAFLIISATLQQSIIFIQLFFALKAMEFYRRKIKKDINAAKLRQADAAAYHAALRKAGGTSVGGIFIGIALNILISALAGIPAVICMLT